MAYVKRDIAERIAATAVKGVSLDDVQLILSEYLTQLATCSMCGGEGRFTCGRKTELILLNEAGDRCEQRFIKQGTTGPCPQCGGPVTADGGGTDPDYVAWHCTEGSDDASCHSCQHGDRNAKRAHAKCGFRVMLPFDPAVLAKD